MRTFLSLLFCAALFTGCVSPRASRSTVYTAVVESGRETGPSLAVALRARVLAVDTRYLVFTDAQIDEMLAFCFKNRHPVYVSESWDCDDFSREFRLLASLWSLRAFPGAEAAPAVATVYLWIEGEVEGIGNYGEGSLHAMVAVRRTDGVWLLVEPANGKRTPILGPLYEGLISVHSAEL